MKKLIQWGNSKFPDFLMFNIPASQEICGRTCKGCYSHKFYRIYPNVLPAQEARYQATLQPDFVSRVVKEVNSKRKPVKYFRIHASAGEFYSYQYIKDWAKIASKLSNITFYAYTKRLKELDFTPLMKLPNVIIIDSFHYGGLNYGTKERAPKGSFICPHDDNITCGKGCDWCLVKGKADKKGVYFLKH